ncbi:MAG: Phospholipid hydroperoxide glutathione peroxidase, mitochondrial, partial [Paramarteilia canceri]
MLSSERSATAASAASQFYKLNARLINGEEVQFSKYANIPLIIVNVACKCGLTKKNFEGFRE